VVGRVLLGFRFSAKFTLIASNASWMSFIIFLDSLSSGASFLTLAFVGWRSFLPLRELDALLGDGLLASELVESDVLLEELLRLVGSSDPEYLDPFLDLWIVFPLRRAFRSDCTEFS
jgi:hypothetical protein